MSRRCHRPAYRAPVRLSIAMAMLSAPLGAVRADPPMDDATEVVATLHGQDVLLQAIGYRLKTANRAFCRSGAADPGFAVHTIGQYAPDYRLAAARAFTLGDLPGVLAVAPESPAERAGLREGDAVVAIDGIALARAAGKQRAADYEATAAAFAAVRAGFGDGRATIEVERSGERLTVVIAGEQACPSEFQVVTDRAMNGRADGDYAQISSELVALADSPDELAALMAHELAHNILRHRTRLDGLAVDRGLLSGVGRNARLIRATEIEADRLSIYLMARAGYDADRGVAIWEKLGRRSGPTGATHPGWRERLRLMAVEQARVRGNASIALPADLAAAVAAAGR